MIYTLGHTDSYEQYFKEQGTPQKKGKTSDYEGGTVWQYEKDALKYLEECCPPGFSIYGVEANWNKDTERSKGELDCLSRSLKCDAKLVKLHVEKV